MDKREPRDRLHHYGAMLILVPLAIDGSEAGGERWRTGQRSAEEREARGGEWRERRAGAYGAHSGLMQKHGLPRLRRISVISTMIDRISMAESSQETIMMEPFGSLEKLRSPSR